MADQKISAMTPVDTLVGDEIIPVVQAGANKSTTPNQIKGFFAYYYPSVTAYADLPAANLHASEIYIVLTSTGVWLFGRKDAGLWYSNGSAWTRLGDIPSYFNSANFQLYDGTDETKVVKFNVAGITHETARTITVPDADITLESSTNKETSALDTSTTKYPCNNVVKSAVDNKASNSFVIAMALALG